MRRLKAVLADIEARAKGAQELYAKGENATTEDVTALQTFKDELETLETEKTTVEQFEADRKTNDARLTELAKVATFALDTTANDGGKVAEFAVPRQKTKNFKGANADVRAYRFGQWFAAAMGNPTARKWCEENNLRQFAMSGDVNVSGGFLVPEEFSSDLIILLEEYGSARRLARNWPMTTDTRNVPKLTAGLTVYSPGQGGQITTSDLTLDNVTLKVDTFLTLTLLSNELLSDSLVNLGDLLIGEIARAFALNEDNMMVNGDGTATYFGRTGIEVQFKALSGTIANIAGLVVAPTNTKTDWANITATAMANVKAKLPVYARVGNQARWLCSENFYGAVMERLAYAAGGVTLAEMQDQINGRFMGSPVEICQVMPRVPIASASAGSIPCFYGNFERGIAFGDRNEYAVARSTEFKFDYNQTAIRGSERVDIVVHSVGNASGTASLRVPGPIVGLIADA